MSKLPQLKQRLESFDDLKTIVTAMKSLSLMESKKLMRYLTDQGKGVSSIKAAASDFLFFYPILPEQASLSKTVIVAIGADRGFCGNFNEEVADAVAEETQSSGDKPSAIIAVGERLAARLNPALKPAGSVDGATFADEVPVVLSSVVRLVTREIETASGGFVNIKILSHQHDREGVSVIEPLTEIQTSQPDYGSPPCLTLAPAEFLPRLLNSYLQFVLYHAFYSSLISESRRRIMHLESALHKLEENVAEFRRHYNLARQEEITEEIEILSLTIPQDPTQQ